MTMGQYVGIGAGTGAVGGAVSSIASDAGRKFVDGEEVTLKQAVCRVAFGATIGAVTGIEGGAVSKAVVSGRISAATTNIKGDVGEQVAMLTGGRRLGNALARKVLPALTESGAESVMGTAAQFVEERLDDSVENQSPGQHLVRGATNLGCNAIKVGVRDTATGLLTHAKNEVIVSKGVKKSSDVDKTERSCLKREERQKLSLENNENLVKYQESTCSATYQPLESEKLLEDETAVVSEEACVLEEHESDQLEDMEIKYISEGAWTSRMIVSFFLDGKKTTQQVSGSGKFVTIPSRAKDIEVKFQVRRPFWGDVMKYNRFREAWFRPYEPHVFRYDKPTNRTFTISGNLWWEAVMGVTNENHDETKEL